MTVLQRTDKPVGLVLDCVDFRERGKPKYTEKNPRSTGDGSTVGTLLQEIPHTRLAPPVFPTTSVTNGYNTNGLPYPPSDFCSVLF